MQFGRNSLLAFGLAAAALATTGCSDRPHEYGEQRPDVGSLHPDDRGLQSKDVIAASDLMTADLLRIPELNDSRTQWTIVVTGMENATTRRRQDYDIFLNRLRTNLAQQAHGRIQLIEQRDRYRNLQSRELEPDADYGGRNRPTGPAGIQPQFALHGQASDLPNRATNYYFLEFDLTDLRSRAIVWANKYEVKTER